MRSFIRGLSYIAYRIFTFGFETSHTFSRYVMYEALRASYPSGHDSGDALSISYSTNILELLNFSYSSLVECNYPEGSIFNIDSANESFDIIVSDQVLEHIEGNPYDAIKELLRVLKPGGVMVHTTCMLVPIHGQDDFWRFTPEGLRVLVEGSGAECLLSEGAGHPIQFLFNLTGWSHLPTPKNRWHPFNWLARLNRPTYPNVVWVIARKPTS